MPPSFLSSVVISDDCRSWLHHRQEVITANSSDFREKAEEHQAHFPEQCVVCEINVSNVHAEKPDYEPAVMIVPV